MGYQIDSGLNYLTVIKPEWADDIARRKNEIWEFNDLDPLEPSQDIDFRQMGGLMVSFHQNYCYESSEGIIDAETQGYHTERIYIGCEKVGTIALTNTLRLEEAARDKFHQHIRIAEQLSRRRNDPRFGLEVWAFPLHALQFPNGSKVAGRFEVPQAR